ncbi:MAG: threonine aldolase family protein [Egibacteraceae bacterium]
MKSGHEENRQDSDVLDFRSDTVTQMTAEMRAAMATARSADMLYDEDRYVNELEDILAGLFGMECLWTPSTTMSNLIGLLLVATGMGCQVLLGKTSHVYAHDRKNAASVGGVAYHALADERGRITLTDLDNSYTVETEFFPRTVAVVLENTHNLAGGTAFPPEYLATVSVWARDRNIAIHLDGARIFNASVSLGVDLRCWGTHGADSIAVSLSKGLGTPAGSALMVKNSRVKQRAKCIRKSLGGTMHTGAGYLAAAAVSLLKKGYDAGIVCQLDEDHRVAAYFAKRLKGLSHYRLVNNVETNILYLSHESIAGPALARQLSLHGILASCLATTSMILRRSEFGSSECSAPIRFVTHRGLTSAHVDQVIDALCCIDAQCCNPSMMLRGKDA